jgi:hypothetical protein
VNLSSEERQTLESMARKYTSPYCDVIRAKIILFADEGLSNDVIASRLDTPFAPGNIEAGSSPAIRTLLAKPDRSSIFTNASGRALTVFHGGKIGYFHFMPK